MGPLAELRVVARRDISSTLAGGAPLPAPIARHRFGRQRAYRLEKSFGTEAFGRGTSVGAQPGGHRPVLHHTADGIAQGGVVARRHDEPRRAMLDKLVGPAIVGNDYRLAHGHGVEKRLVPARMK